MPEEREEERRGLQQYLEQTTPVTLFGYPMFFAETGELVTNLSLRKAIHEKTSVLRGENN